MATTLGSFIAGGVAACGAVTVTHSFETVKIRLQLQGELQSKGNAPKLYRGVGHGLKIIYKNEGMKGLLRGLNCAYIYQTLLNGCRLGFYDTIRTTTNSVMFHHNINDRNMIDIKQRQNMAINMFAGASSGCLGAIAGAPFFLLKTRLQSYSPVLPVGTQYHYRNAIDGMKQIYRAEGATGLYRGVGPAMLRTSIGSSVQLPTYFLAKRQLLKHTNMQESPSLHLLSSAIAGVVVCCVMHPPDTIMSRMCNQSGDLYSSAFDCFFRTIRTEGIFALYKGFTAHLARMLPHTTLTLTFAEQTSKLMMKVEDRYVPEDLRKRI